MFRMLKWRRLNHPAIYAGLSIAALSESMVVSVLAHAAIAPALILAAGGLIAGLIASASIRVAYACQHHTLSTVRVANSRRRVSAQWQRLKLAQEAATAASRAKTNFYASVSHELRTPLNGIIGMSRIVLETALGDDQRQSLQTISASSEALLLIVNDILDYSKIEAGKLELRPGRFDLRRMLQDLSSLTSTSVPPGRTLEIVLDYPDELPLWFSGDAGRIRQIATNFIGNAAKFTGAGGVRIAVTANQGAGGTRDANCFEVDIAVTDHGPGIPKNRLAAIFEEFVQLDTGVGGTGLGLPISKRLAALMGGQIDVQSELGAGSTFTLRLPLALAAPDAVLFAVPTATAAQQPVGPRLRVLVAEDNKTNRQVLASMLRTEHIEITLACDGREAVQMFLETAPALILMDVSMPKMNGFEATAHIRNLEKLHGLARTPIVALTANAVRGDRAKCLDANMDDYMSKPLLKKVLVAMIDKWVHQGGCAAHEPIFANDRRQPGNTPRSLTGRTRQAPVIDELRIAALIADLGEETVLNIADQFGRDMTDALTRLTECVTASNTDDVRLTVNLIRSCASNLGIARLVQVCDGLQLQLVESNVPPMGAIDELTGAFGQAQTALKLMLAGGRT